MIMIHCIRAQNGGRHPQQPVQQSELPGTQGAVSFFLNFSVLQLGLCHVIYLLHYIIEAGT